MSAEAKYSTNQLLLARLSKAMAHPARIAIIEHLMVQESCVCGEIVSVLPLSQATVSQHLRALKDENIIIGEIDGPKVCYRLNLNQMELMAAELDRFLKSVGGFPSCC